MTILEFFDVYRYDHLQAFKHLTEKGQWPEGFIPDDLEFEHLWVVTLQARMAQAWIFHNESCYRGEPFDGDEA